MSMETLGTILHIMFVLATVWFFVASYIEWHKR
jgi:hypothetical protein